MENTVFITGTDTGVGKTIVTGLLGRFLMIKGMNAATQKWVQTGCAGFSEDIESHMTLMGKAKKDIERYLAEMAPYVLEFPASPHLAARLEKKRIYAEKIEEAFLKLRKDFEVVIVEGTGGLMVPIDDGNMIVDIVDDLSLPVLVVAENRLGAINQTVMTIEVLKKRNIPIMGIIFNRLDKKGNETILKDNPRIVENLTGIEVLGELPYEKYNEKLYKAFVPIGEKVLGKMQEPDL